MTADLMNLKLELKKLDDELAEYGMPKAVRDRIGAFSFVLDVTERERQKRGFA